MLGLVLRVATLTVVYLSVLSSPQVADLPVGLFLSVVLVGARALVHPPGGAPRRSPDRFLLWRLVGVPALIGGTVVDIARGSGQVAAYCLGIRRLRTPGVVAVPISPGAESSATAWGIRVGLAPDSVVVDVDEGQGRMLVHVLDAHDPAAIRDEQLDLYRRRQRRVFP